MSLSLVTWGTAEYSNSMEGEQPNQNQTSQGGNPPQSSDANSMPAKQSFQGSERRELKIPWPNQPTVAPPTGIQISPEAANINHSENKQSPQAPAPEAEVQGFIFNAGVETEKKYKANIRKVTLIVGLSAVGVMLLGSLIGYWLYLSPSAQAKNYYKKLTPIINNISDQEKKSEEQSKKLSQNQIQFSSAVLSQKNAHKLFEEYSKIAAEYYAVFKKERANFEGLGEKSGNLESLQNNLSEYFKKGDDFLADFKGFLAYFENYTSMADEWGKLSTINYYDYSEKNYNEISDLAEAIRLKMEIEEPPRGFEKFNETITNWLSLVEQAGDLGRNIIGGAKSGNYWAIEGNMANLKLVVQDLLVVEEQMKDMRPEASYYDDTAKQIDDLAEKVNQDLEKISSKYKLNPLKIYISPDLPTSTNMG